MFTTGFPGGEGLFGPDVLFSYPSFWSLINPLNSSCVNAPDGLDGEARQCMEGEIDSGVSCESGGAACGRPADFPDQQFYVPIDLQVRSLLTVATGPGCNHSWAIALNFQVTAQKHAQKFPELLYL